MANKKQGCLGAGKEGLATLGRIQDSVIGSCCFCLQRKSYRFTFKENKLDPGDRCRCRGGFSEPATPGDLCTRPQEEQWRSNTLKLVIGAV